MAYGFKTGGRVAIYSAIEFTCETCKCKFKSKNAYKSYVPKFCSQSCWAKRKISQETREKQSAAKLGKEPWNKSVAMWKDRPHPRGTLGMKIDKKPYSDETKKRLSLSHRGIKLPDRSGEKHWNWQGGKSSETIRARASGEYKNWRRSVFEGDDYTCQICGMRGGYLHADHIVPFSVDKSKRFDIDNGRTLCVTCHRQTETYGTKALNYAV